MPPLTVIIVTSPLSGLFPGHELGYFHLDSNGKRRQEKNWGPKFLAGFTQEGGGGGIQMHTLYNRGGVGGGGCLKIRKNAYVIDGRPYMYMLVFSQNDMKVYLKTFTYT